MSLDLSGWKDKITNKFNGWNPRHHTTKTIYAALAAMALWPFAESVQSGEYSSLIVLGSLLGNIGSNLVANVIQTWKDENTAAKEIETHLDNPELLAGLDRFLQEVGVVEIAQNALLNDPEKLEYFINTLNQNLSDLGNLSKYQAVLVNSTMVQGDGARLQQNISGVIFEGGFSGNFYYQGRSGTEQEMTGPAQIEALIGRSQTRLSRTLTEDRDNNFFQKYISAIYAKRDDSEEKFQRFVRQYDKHCFTVTGQAGKGKTSLLCHFADTSTGMEGKQINLLLNSAELRTLEQKSLTDYMLAELDFTAPGEPDPFATLGTLLADEEARLIVFIDAINELEGENAFSLFNDQFTALVKTVINHQYPIWFCVSCRSEFWGQFTTNSWWANSAIFEKLGPGKPTVILGNFGAQEVKEISRSYFRWYALHGELAAQALEGCRDPLMLRYLCAAYTNRDQHDKQTSPEDIPVRTVGYIRTVRRKAVFDAFVKARRNSIVATAKRAIKANNPGRATQPTGREIYWLTTYYLMKMAEVMLQKRRAYITADEAFRVAVKLDHPDAKIGRERFQTDPGSMFFGLIDEGVILTVRDTNTFSFVFESYFEYTLGRYIALVRWPELSDGELDVQKIEQDFEHLIRLHTELSGQNFTNLFGALQYAILVTEEEAGETAEEKIYQGYPTLYVQLIQRMSAVTVRGFDWIQQACSTLRETTLAQRANWDDLAEQELKSAEKRFNALISILDRLTLSTDFVVLWDISNTLQQLAVANFDLTFNHILAWAEEGDGLQPIFATQVLAKLALQQPLRVSETLIDLAQDDRFRNDFWLARSLIFATVELAKRRHQLDLSSRNWRELQNQLRNLSQAPDPAIRGVALAALPFLASNSTANLRWVREQAERETWSWGLWNLAYELHNWPTTWSDGDDDWIWEMLGWLADQDDPHVRYAVDKTAKRLAQRNESMSKIIRHRLRRNRWKADLAPSRFNLAQVAQLGVVYSPAYLEPAYDNHVECRERLQAILEQLHQSAENQFNWITPRPAQRQNLEWVHSSETDRHRTGSLWLNYIDDVEQGSVVAQRGDNAVTLRTGPSELRYESYDIALLSVGGVLQAIDYVLQGPALAAFAINRPPGHLANNTICIFNNIAIGARYAQHEHGMERILIVDCDAHQGKHTNQVFLQDPNIIYFSMHFQGDYAKETGQVEHIGEGAGAGYNFNLPYPKRMKDDGYFYMIDKLLVPLIQSFQPEMLLISAGFDGHEEDPLTPDCELTDAAYIYLAQQLHNTAESLSIKIVGCIEGGYGLAATARCFVGMLGIIGNWDSAPTMLPPRKSDEATLDEVKELVAKRIQLADGLFDFPK